MRLFVIDLVLLCTVTSYIVPASQLAYMNKDTNYVPGHDVMVHLLEWKWTDIAEECESFLGLKGYGGIQVSPIQENIIIPTRPWWERYQPVSYRWLTRSGNERQFREMVEKCNQAGVRIYVDIIINHMTADHSFPVIGTGNSIADPPSRDYSAVPYNRSDFHKSCSIVDYNDPNQVRNCELVGLHDLDQSNEHVKQTIIKFMNDVIDAGVAGFRIDAAKHMWPSDLNFIYSRLKNLSTNHGFQSGKRPYIYQEVIDMGGEGISKMEYNDLGVVTEFRYGFEISRGMRGINSLKWFKNFGEMWGMVPSNDALVFIDNHDNQRSNSDGGSVLTYKEPKMYKMAIAFMLAHPYGIPRIISSFAFHNKDQGPPSDIHENLVSPLSIKTGSCVEGWICEHRWRQISNMVHFRKVVNGTVVSEWWDNGNNQIAFSRGNTGFIAFNSETFDLNQKLHTKLSSGVYCEIISGNKINGNCTGKTVFVDENGYADVKILSDAEDGTIAIHVDVSRRF
ncbi:hypothetical protein PV327_008769 [Microctonus hyperodae]|uniref:Alpha-amylase n=1 Tax=Microctonus hyperodae TaxID=165561 RepID=A0AA39KV22_MICHY|nr:hypothetical protein PV327_008769 [Microctonus hyperodae]